MHATALANAERFFNAYIIRHESPSGKIVEIGSQNVTGSIKQACPDGMEYIGVDFVSGKDVDIVISDPYKLPFEDGSIGYCVCSSVFEHSEMFWVLFLEILRILKPEGLFYLNVPSNGPFHRYPVDCWRFYPDSGNALVNWAIRNGMNPKLLESYISYQDKDSWNDFVAVFIKDAEHVQKYPYRILDSFAGYYNGRTSNSDNVLSQRTLSEDEAKLHMINSITSNTVRFNWQ